MNFENLIFGGIMRKLLLLLVCSIALSITACGPNRNDELTSEQIAKEKERVLNVVKEYNKANQNKSFSSIIETLSNDVVFFGSDSSEVIRNLTDFQKMIKKQWELYNITYGDMVDVWIDIDSKGTIASVISGMPGEVHFQGQNQKYFFRVARNLKKQNNKWLISSGITGITQQMPVPAEPAALQ